MEKWFGFGDNGMAPRAATEELGCDKDSGDRRQQLDDVSDSGLGNNSVRSEYS